jgi:hypothetical protein
MAGDLVRDAVLSDPASTLFSLIYREYTGKLTISGLIRSMQTANSAQNSAIS